MKRRRLPLLLLLALLLALGWAGGRWYYRNWREQSQDAPILTAARRYGVEPALVKAVVWRESWFDPEARGRKGELGLMQVLPNAAARDWTDAAHAPAMPPGHLLDPGTNTLVGAWYLNHLLRRYSRCDDPVPYALADYNAGRGNVLKWQTGAAATNSAAFIAQIGFPSTRRYVQAVMLRREHYRPIFPGQPAH